MVSTKAQLLWLEKQQQQQDKNSLKFIPSWAFIETKNDKDNDNEKNKVLNL